MCRSRTFSCSAVLYVVFCTLGCPVKYEQQSCTFLMQGFTMRVRCTLWSADVATAWANRNVLLCQNTIIKNLVAISNHETQMSPFAVAGLWDLRHQPWRRLAQGEPTEECWGLTGRKKTHLRYQVYTEQRGKEILSCDLDRDLPRCDQYCWVIHYKVVY